ncbi:MAG TPA: hypothetical protein ENN11_04995 [Methanomicrobia archaeon]|nr:hypothetical protein [Methanomicrobia archaeon]
MRDSFKTGFSFGLTSGIITTLGLVMGLYAGTKSEPAIIGGIITIAIADAFSDSLGIHISEESKCAHDDRHVWESTVSTFLSKFVFALTFVIPIMTFCLRNAVIMSVAWGFFLLVVANFYIARIQPEFDTCT